MQNKGIETNGKNERIKDCGCGELQGADCRNLGPWLKTEIQRGCGQWVAMENKLNCKVYLCVYFFGGWEGNEEVGGHFQLYMKLALRLEKLS